MFHQADAKNGKKTGDRTGVGFFIPLSPGLGNQFPSLGDDDKSPPHTTFLYIGSVTEEQEALFLETTTRVLGEAIKGPVRGSLDHLEHFTHPAKNRSVAVTTVRFDQDLSDLRWKLREALLDAGIQVDDSFPLVYHPHVTLAYLEGLDAKWDKPVPTGSWAFTEIEIWGLPKLHVVPFGGFVPSTGKVASRYMESMEHRTSVALMKFLSDVAIKAGVSKHVYVVGGAVRNFVIGQPVKDVDVVIDSVAAGKDSAWFAKVVQKAIPVPTSLVTNQYGVAILTVKGEWDVDGANLQGEVLEIANARKESYGAGGYKPDMIEPATIEEDVVRREFTFNTLLWRLHDLADGPDKAQIIDLTGCGLKDLAAGEMRCPSDPDKTFGDDPSRMVRAVKFLLKYGFKIPADVEASIKRNAGKLRNIPAGHLSNMIIGLFYEGGWGRRALDELDKLGLLDVIKDIARTDRSFREALVNWADKKADLSFLFELIDIGMPTGHRLNFLTPSQKDQLREMTVQWSAAESDDFVSMLEQPGKIKGLDLAGLIQEQHLVGPAIRGLTDLIRQALLDDPTLVKDSRRLRGVVGAPKRQGKTSKVAAEEIVESLKKALKDLTGYPVEFSAYHFPSAFSLKKTNGGNPVLTVVMGPAVNVTDGVWVFLSYFEETWPERNESLINSLGALVRRLAASHGFYLRSWELDKAYQSLNFLLAPKKPKVKADVPAQLYHIAPSDVRDSIKARGLIPGGFGSAERKNYGQSERGPRVYAVSGHHIKQLADDLHYGKNAFDVWKIDTKRAGLDWYPDEEYKWGVWTENQIPSNSLTLKVQVKGKTSALGKPLDKAWVMAVRRGWLTLLKPPIQDFKDVLKAFDKLDDFAVNLLEQVQNVHRGLLRMDAESVKMEEPVKLLREKIRNSRSNAKYWGEWLDGTSVGFRFGEDRTEDAKKMLELYKTNFADASNSYTDKRKSPKNPWGNGQTVPLTYFVDQVLKRLYELVKKNVEMEERFGPDEDYEPFFREFAMGNMKVLVSDPKTHGTAIKYFIRQLDRAKTLLEKAGFAKDWKGLLTVQSADFKTLEPWEVQQWSQRGYDIKALAGTYTTGTDSVVITAPADDRLAHTIVHELGHRHWFKFLDSSDRAKFAAWMKEGLAPVSAYGETNTAESFAEVFADYVMRKDMSRDQLESFKSLMGKTAKSKGLSEEAENQKYLDLESVDIRDFLQSWYSMHPDRLDQSKLSILAKYYPYRGKAFRFATVDAKTGFPYNESLTSWSKSLKGLTWYLKNSPEVEGVTIQGVIEGVDISKAAREFAKEWGSNDYWISGIIKSDEVVALKKASQVESLMGKTAAVFKETDIDPAVNAFALAYGVMWDKYQLVYESIKKDIAIDLLSPNPRPESRWEKLTAIRTKSWVNNPWVRMVNVGSHLVRVILDQKSIPKAQIKKMEAVSKLMISARRFPLNFMTWISKNDPLLKFLRDEPKTWSGKVEGGDELFKVGPFTVHNVLGLADDDLTGFKVVFEKAASLISRMGGDYFDLKKILYGDVFLVAKLSQPRTLAWYNLKDDSIYARQMKTLGLDDLENLIHELGHRYWNKFMPKARRALWIRHHTGVVWKSVEVPKYQKGDRLPLTINKVKEPLIVDFVGGKYQLALPTKDDPDKIVPVAFSKIFDWLKGHETNKKFPTPYAAKGGVEEHFCESLALKVMGKLPPEHEAALDQVFTGKDEHLPSDNSFYQQLQEDLAARRASIDSVAYQHLKKAGYFNVGDQIYFGKYKNKAGVIRGFGRKENGTPTVLIEPFPKGRKQDKELGLYTIWHADVTKRVAARYLKSESLDEYQTKDGRPITFKVEENSTHSNDKDMLPGGKSAWVLHRVIAFVEGEEVGYVTLSYIPAAKFKLKFPSIWHYLGRVAGWGSDLIGLWEAKDWDGLWKRVYLYDRWRADADATPHEERMAELKLIAKKHEKEFQDFKEFHVNKPIVDFIKVEGEFRGQGIGTALHNYAAAWLAKTKNLPLWVSGIQTDDGKGLWKSLQQGLSAPKIRKYKDRQMVDFRASVDRVAAKYQDKKTVKTKDGEDMVVYEYSDRQIADRNRGKAERVEKLRGKLDKLVSRVKKDLKSDDLETRMSALVVGLVNDTFERIGNEGSAKDGHFGVTGWQVKHITFGNGAAKFHYVGKSGVDHKKETTDKDLIRVLKEAVKGKKDSDSIFDMGDVKITADTVNKYLKPFDITAKDIRGLHANREVQEALKAIRSKRGKLPEDKKEREKELKEEFKEAIEIAAEAVGHEAETLRSQYLVPGVELNFLRDGTVKENLAKQKTAEWGQW